MSDFQVIPAVTTIARCSSGWSDKIREIEELGLRSVALFLTGVSELERRKLYRELEMAHIRHLFTVPFVHAVSDMSDDEYRYLMDRFGTELFNLHPVRQYPLQHKLSTEIRRRIAIENSFIDRSIELMDLSGFQGLCLDVAHAEDVRRKNGPEFETLERLTKMAPVLANHISLSGEKSQLDSEGNPTFHSHVTQEGRGVSYLERYSASFFGPIVAIELADPLAEQMKLVPLIEDILTAKSGRKMKKAA